MNGRLLMQRTTCKKICDDAFSALQGELRFLGAYSLKLIPPSIHDAPADFIHGEFFLSPYLKIIGDLSFDKLARCHFTQERMQWEWEALSALPNEPSPAL